MSTRALYIFSDNDSDESYIVYKHHDGYPEGAKKSIQSAAGLAWEFPRFEADEFAAAFVAANKDRPGGIRLFPAGMTVMRAIERTSDARYVYWIDFPATTSRSKRTRKTPRVRYSELPLMTLKESSRKNLSVSWPRRYKSLETN